MSKFEIAMLILLALFIALLAWVYSFAAGLLGALMVLVVAVGVCLFTVFIGTRG